MKPIDLGKPDKRSRKIVMKIVCYLMAEGDIDLAVSYINNLKDFEYSQVTRSGLESTIYSVKWIKDYVGQVANTPVITESKKLRFDLLQVNDMQLSNIIDKFMESMADNMEGARLIDILGLTMINNFAMLQNEIDRLDTKFDNPYKNAELQLKTFREVRAAFANKMTFDDISEAVIRSLLKSVSSDEELTQHVSLNRHLILADAQVRLAA